MTKQKRPYLYISFLAFLTSCAFNPGQRLNEGTISEAREIEFQNQKVILAPLPYGINSSRQLTDVPIELTEYKTPEYRLGKYDVITVVVWDHPELSQPLGQYRSDIGTGLIIDENGEMFYPYVGTIKAEGFSTGELRDKLAQALDRFIQEPQVDVKVLRFRSQKIDVIGAVAKSSTIYLQDVPLTLSEAINQAGGISAQGDASQIELRRQDKLYRLNWYGSDFKSVEVGRIELQDGDEIRISSRQENKIYIAGAVVNPGSIPLNNGKMSLTQAISEVGGLDQKTSNPEELYVLRWEDDAIKVFNLDVQNPMALVLGDLFELKSRDLVFVDTHGLVEWNRFLSLILPTMNIINSGASTTNEIMILKNKFK